MRVLMFGWEYPPHITGGLGTACKGLTEALADEQVEVLFVVPKRYGGESVGQRVHVIGAEEVVLDPHRIARLTVDSPLTPYVSPENYSAENQGYADFWDHRHQHYRFTGNYGVDLYAEVQRYAHVAGQIAHDLAGQFDVIHAHDWLTYAAGIAAKKVSGKPLVVHVHATEYDRSGEQINRRVWEIERAGMQAADRVVTVSNLTRAQVVNRYGIDQDKVITVYNGVAFASGVEYPRVLSDKIVTFLGRITFQKGPDFFIEAAAKVLRYDRNVRFVMAGTGDLLPHAVSYVARLGISDRFHFTGFLRGEEVHRMFAASDLYVMPSVSEPFGISPLEAMQSGVPVIISKQSGVAEILRNALKVDYWDTDAVADAIHALIHYPTLGRYFRRKVRIEAQNNDWQEAASLLKSLYERLRR